MKGYFCRRYPNYRIGRKVEFENGEFYTNDIELIKLIESNDWYKVFVWPINGKDYANDSLEEETKAEGREVEAEAETGEGPLNGSEGEGRLPTPLKDNREASRPGKGKRGGGKEQGRKEGPVLQELEELVRGSGIVSI